MAILPILEHPDPRLREIARPVETFDAAFSGFVDDLVDTLASTGAIGLAAPQVAAPVRVLVVDLSGDGSTMQVYVNPEIVETHGLGLVEESCVSLPGIVGNVIRAAQVRVRAQSRTGEAFECELEGMESVCLQHELDHLEGKLFIDRLSVFQRLRLRATAIARGLRRTEAA